MGWLAKCAIACEKEQAIKTIFRRNNVGFKRQPVRVIDLTEEDDDRIYYHQRLILDFWTSVTHVHKNHNFKVDDVDISAAIAME